MTQPVMVPKYAHNGIANIWIIDPGKRSLEVYRKFREHFIPIGAHAEADRVWAEPFDAVELDLSLLWLPE